MKAHIQVASTLWDMHKVTLGEIVVLAEHGFVHLLSLIPVAWTANPDLQAVD